MACSKCGGNCGGDQMGNVDWLTLATNPDQVMQKYIDIGVKQATRFALLQVVAFSLITWTIVSAYAPRRN